MQGVQSSIEISFRIAFLPPRLSPSCMYRYKMTSWSSLKISDGAQIQFQRIKKSLLPKTRKEGQCFLQAKTVPHLPRFFITGLISFVLSFFNLIFELCRRRCRLKGLPLRKPKPYCNRPRSNVLSNSPRQRIRLLSARRNRSKANKSTHRRNCRRRPRGQRYASRTSLKNTLRRSLTACPTSCYRLRKDFRGALSQRL